MEKYMDFSITRPAQELSRLGQESEYLLARLPSPEPVNSFTPEQLSSAKRSLEENIARHSREFPGLKDVITTAGNALIDGDLSALQGIFGRRQLDSNSSQTLAQELDRNLTLLGVRVTLNRYGDDLSLDVLRVGDSTYLSVPLDQSHTPCIRGPVTYGDGDAFSLGGDMRGGTSAAQKQLERIRRTIIAWQAF